MCGEIAAIISDIHTEGRTVILVEQNARLALALAQHAYVIETGDIVLSGPAEELRENDNVKKWGVTSPPATTYGLLGCMSVGTREA
jgi:ABC-type branched-subunit amino acid transport system ATPase component